jgi:hypothetical protein
LPLSIGQKYQNFSEKTSIFIKNQQKLQKKGKITGLARELLQYISEWRGAINSQLKKEGLGYVESGGF